MNMFARFDENQAMTFQDIKETKRYGRTNGRTDAHTDAHTPTDNVKTVYPPQTKFAGGIMSRGMRFPTMWYVRAAKPQISLRIRAV